MPHKNCQILFNDNDHGTYFTGQTVTGRVLINVNKTKKVKGIRLHVYGFASCQWIGKFGNHRPRKYVTGRRKHVYFGREDYIAATTYLVGSENGQICLLNPGIHTYNFACPIPENCPSSFEGTFGHIRYMIKVIFMYAGAADRVQSKGFTVIKLLDLNRESRMLWAAASNESLENFCLLYSQPVHLKVDMLQTGYVPGQFILISAHVRNDSSVDVKKLLITLLLRASYTSFTPCLRTTSEKIVLVKKHCGPVPSKTQKNFAETIRVPATAPTCEHLCKVVRVSYEICVQAIMNPLIRNPKAVIPITIGNVPLIGATDELPTLNDGPTTSREAMQLAGGRTLSGETETEIENAADAPEENEDGDDEDDGLPEMPPPTYEEAMFMSTDIADPDVNQVNEAAHFTPRYPVYDVDNVLKQGPAPNPPQKRRKRRKKKKKQRNAAFLDEELNKPPRESPVQI